MSSIYMSVQIPYTVQDGNRTLSKQQEIPYREGRYALNESIAENADFKQFIVQQANDEISTQASSCGCLPIWRRTPQIAPSATPQEINTKAVELFLKSAEKTLTNASYSSGGGTNTLRVYIMGVPPEKRGPVFHALGAMRGTATTLDPNCQHKPYFQSFSEYIEQKRRLAPEESITLSERTRTTKPTSHSRTTKPTSH